MINKPIWLVKASHVTQYIQTECFILGLWWNSVWFIVIKYSQIYFLVELYEILNTLSVTKQGQYRFSNYLQFAKVCQTNVTFAVDSNLA